MRRIYSLVFALACVWMVLAQDRVVISDPEHWNVNELLPFVGKNVVFDVPMVICNSYSSLTVSPHRTFSPTNQALPGSDEYRSVVSLNGCSEVSLSGVSGYHRTGERIESLEAKVIKSGTQIYLSYVSGQFVGNTRADLMKGPDMSVIDPENERNLLVCTMNLEYYLAYQFDPSSSMGPRDAAQHVKQREKTIKALSTIDADLYGFVEIQCGDSALREITNYMNKALPHRDYKYIPSGTAASGTYTQSCYMYDAKKVEPKGARVDIDAEVANRKKMQIFREKESEETFIFSLNHFKAKSGSGTGLNADQGDGQGLFNQRRVNEAIAVLDRYSILSIQAKDSDMLVMGDLNAYAMEDPIMTFVRRGAMTDLHRYFHADSSYSYTFRGQAGYLDHALCTPTMLPQITGMAAFHINSDEDDRYTYDGSWNDGSMFRCSDHDPVVVGLRLNKALRPSSEIQINAMSVLEDRSDIVIKNAKFTNTPAYYAIYTISGLLVSQGEIDSNAQIVPRPSMAGMYILMVYANGSVSEHKVLIK